MAVSAVAFLEAAIVTYASLGVKVARVVTDNGSAYRSVAFARAYRTLKIKPLRTKPYTPKTNGKAERFFQTALRECEKLTQRFQQAKPVGMVSGGLRKGLSDVTSKSRGAADLDPTNIIGIVRTAA